jgi:hypothetical protein
MAKILLALALLTGLGSTLPTSVLAQETEDQQAIRALFEREQEGWRNGDGTQVLSCYAKSYIDYNIPIRNGEPNFLQAHIGSGSYESRKSQVLSGEFVGLKAALADTALAVSHKYELNHIDVSGNEGVAISTISWVHNDTLRHTRIQEGHQTMWMVRKVDGEWKYASAVYPLSRYREENPLQN